MIFIALHRKDGTEEAVQPAHITRMWRNAVGDGHLTSMQFANGLVVEYRETSEQVIEMIRSASPVTKYV